MENRFEHAKVINTPRDIPVGYYALSSIIDVHPNTFKCRSTWHYLIHTGKLPSVYLPRKKRGSWYVSMSHADTIAKNHKYDKHFNPGDFAHTFPQEAAYDTWRLINLTPHAITVHSIGATGETNGPPVVFAPSGTVARLETVCEEDSVLIIASMKNIKIAPAGRVTGVVDLPPMVPGTLLIVSGMVRDHVGRRDLVSPGTDPAHLPVRDSEGRLTAVKCLVAANAAYCEGLDNYGAE